MEEIGGQNESRKGCDNTGPEGEIAHELAIVGGGRIFLFQKFEEDELAEGVGDIFCNHDYEEGDEVGRLEKMAKR